jgi:uncharacterized protein HemY
MTMTELKPVLKKLTEAEIDAIYYEAIAADERGDEDEFNRLMNQVPASASMLQILKEAVGIKDLIASGKNLYNAVEVYGEEWLRS